MRIGVVTLFPEMLRAVTDYGITARAVDNALVSVQTWNPRDYATDRHRSVDDRPYGGGPGMVMMVEPLRSAIRAAREALAPSTVIYLSPRGRRLNQAAVKALRVRGNLVLVAGRYEGVDQRLIDAEIDEEWSVGDYVLSGGELPAMILIDAMVRLLPGALGDADSAEQDSFVEGLLDCDHYTRPEEIDGRRVPDVLMSGNHKMIARWRRKQALGSTWLKRPDLLQDLTLSKTDLRLLEEYIAERDSGAGGKSKVVAARAAGQKEN
ncbi:MAG: tRNA (guanosine(37)-N1)-methyltransferase TrmD [Gammaproteobacteria bacterium]